MSGAREAVLAGIRRALHRGELDPSAKSAIDERLSQPRPNLLPSADGDLAERFIARASALSATIARVAALEGVPAEVAAYLAKSKLSTRLVVAAPLAGLPWPAALSVRTGAAEKDDLVCVTPCFAAVAETGSLVLLSGADSPTTLNFVPDDHIVIVRIEQIVRHIEQVWSKVRESHDMLPRTINIISGPSRTADVEQTLQLGAHGPRSLHVILVGA